MLKTIDFIDDCEMHRSKKQHIPSHRLEKCKKRLGFLGFHEIPMGWLCFDMIFQPSVLLGITFIK